MEGVNEKLILALLNPASKRSYFIIRHCVRKAPEDFCRSMQAAYSSQLRTGEHENTQLIRRILDTLHEFDEEAEKLPVGYRLQLMKFGKKTEEREREGMQGQDLK